MRPQALLAALLVVGALLAFGVEREQGASALFTDQASVGSNAFSSDTLNAASGLTAGCLSTVNLSWTATSDTYASGHRVFRSATSGGPYSQIAEVTPRTTTTYSDSPGAGTYYYVVRAYFQNWESADSNEAARIALRNSASASAASGTLTLTISKPSGTVQNDVMVAAIAVRPQTAVITAPSGWNLVRRLDNAAITASSQATYYKVAGSSEPASYAWTFSTSTGSAGGIMSFSGANTTSPINIQNGQTTASSLSHATPSVNTSAINTMVVTFHSFPSSETWTPPGGMAEAFDLASLAVPNGAGISIEGNYVCQPAAGATGIKTATASGVSNPDPGNAEIIALNPKQ